MPRVNYVEHNGQRHEIDVPNGFSVMEGAVNHGVPGIDGDCGGACACATCHVYVDPAWVKKLMPPNELEADMLGFAHEPDERSRLSCQIKMTPELDGLTVYLPSQQY
jgi:2Fe-2S ferredoxin